MAEVPIEPPGRGGARAVQGAVLILTAGTCWSLAGLFVRAMEEAEAWQILVYRSAATLVFVAIALAFRNGGPPWPAVRALGWKGPLAGALLAYAMLSFIVALTLTTVFNAVMTISISPLLAAALGRMSWARGARHWCRCTIWPWLRPWDRCRSASACSFSPPAPSG